MLLSQGCRVCGEFFKASSFRHRGRFPDLIILSHYAQTHDKSLSFRCAQVMYFPEVQANQNLFEELSAAKGLQSQVPQWFLKNLRHGSATLSLEVLRFSIWQFRLSGCFCMASMADTSVIPAKDEAWWTAVDLEGLIRHPLASRSLRFYAFGTEFVVSGFKVPCCMWEATRTNLNSRGPGLPLTWDVKTFNTPPLLQ